MFVVQAEGGIIHGRASVVVNLQPPSKSVGRPRNSTHHLFPISPETRKQYKSAPHACLISDRHWVSLFVFRAWPDTSVSPRRHFLRQAHALQSSGYFLSTEMHCIRPTNKRKIPKTPTTNVLIDIFKCPASTDHHRSMGRQGFFGSGSQKRLPPNRGTNVLLALSIALPVSPAIITYNKSSPRRYLRR